MRIRLYWNRWKNMWTVKTSRETLHVQFVDIYVPMRGVTQKRSPRAHLVGDGRLSYDEGGCLELRP